MPAGLKRPPTDRSGDAPKPSKLPHYIRAELRKHASAWKFFQSLAPSYRRLYINWIETAKLEETKMKRLQQAISRLAAGQKPGLK